MVRLCSRQYRLFRLSSADATHIDNATIALSDSDFKVSVSSPCPINEEPTAAVYTAHIPETTIAKQPFALTAGYSSTSV